ncbi:hypothetical protein RhiJN_15313 [Ceratobasidium sp. AG-Ba]|nr:hypothetical protein RhiJN_15313 [Ceratobasidium sp. AG-Ba]
MPRTNTVPLHLFSSRLPPRFCARSPFGLCPPRSLSPAAMRFLSIAAFAGLAAATHVSAHKLEARDAHLDARTAWCEAGKGWINNRCQDCSPGQYSAGGYNAMCKSCPTGSTSSTVRGSHVYNLRAPNFVSSVSLIACASPVSTSTAAGLPATPATRAPPVTPAARVLRGALLAPPTLGLRLVAHARLALLATPRTRLLDPASPNAQPVLTGTMVNAAPARLVLTLAQAPPLARPAPVERSPTPTVLPAARPALPVPPAVLVRPRALLSTARPESTQATARAPTALQVLTVAPTLPLARPAQPTRSRPVVPLPAPPARLVPLACPVLPSARLPAKPASTSRTAGATPARPVGTPRLAPPSVPTALKTPTPTPALALAPSARPARDAVAARLLSISALTSALMARSTPTDAAKTARLVLTATTTCARIARLVPSPTPAPSRAMPAPVDQFLRPTARLAPPARATRTPTATTALLARLARRVTPVRARAVLSPRVVLSLSSPLARLASNVVTFGPVVAAASASTL